jgi:hypothetical protein
MRLLSRITTLLPAPLIALAACDVAAPTAPAEMTQSVSYSQTPKSNLHLVETTSGTEGASVSAVITPSGGAVEVGQHQLVVPKGAVIRPTVFTMTLLDGRNLILDLHAIDKASGDEVDTFVVPVQLRLSYADLQLSDKELNDLVVVWLPDGAPNGRLVPVPTATSAGAQYVSAWLTHFSAYAMGMN